MGEEGGLSRPVAAIILAAGGSARMGQLKQLLPIGERPMVRHVTDIVSSAGLAQVVVVVGSHGAEVVQALCGLPVDVIENKDWAQGMSTSIRAGLLALGSGIRAAIIVLADQPGLTAELLQSLVVRYQMSGAPIVAPFLQGRRGNPVLFDSVLVPELLEVEGDQGGRDLVERYMDQLDRVEIDDPAAALDVDTYQDYQHVLESSLGK
jgi:molybdenum cofactor cytidylyltransferase